jgi:hypothetical protein
MDFKPGIYFARAYFIRSLIYRNFVLPGLYFTEILLYKDFNFALPGL